MMLANLGGLYSAGKSELQALINNLFGEGQQGLLFVPQPVVLNEQRLYKLDNFTDPVTAGGDPVGGGKEVSGNGNHITQSVSADRPTYQTDGTLHWAQFDGVDDYMSGAPNFVSTSFSALVACRANTTGVKGVFKAGQGDLSFGGVNEFVLFRPAGSSSGVQDETGVFRSHSFGVAADTDAVVEIHFSPSSIEFVLDGVLVNTINDTFEVVSFTENMFVGRSDVSSPGQFWDGDVSGVIFRDGVMSESEKTSARNYLAGLQGRTL